MSRIAGGLWVKSQSVVRYAAARRNAIWAVMKIKK